MAEAPTHDSHAPSPASDHAPDHAPSPASDHVPSHEPSPVPGHAPTQASDVSHHALSEAPNVSERAPSQAPNVNVSHHAPSEVPNVPAAPVVLTPAPTVPVYAHWRDQPSMRTFIHHFAGWRVLYTGHGNSTLLLNSDGPMHYLDAPVRTLVQAVADWYYLDLEMLHKLYFKWTGHRLAMPSPWAPVGTCSSRLRPGNRVPRMTASSRT